VRDNDSWKAYDIQDCAHSILVGEREVTNDDPTVRYILHDNNTQPVSSEIKTHPRSISLSL
jgi:hypothetical protein